MTGSVGGLDGDLELGLLVFLDAEGAAADLVMIGIGVNGDAVDP